MTKIIMMEQKTFGKKTKKQISEMLPTASIILKKYAYGLNYVIKDANKKTLAIWSTDRGTAKLSIFA